MIDAVMRDAVMSARRRPSTGWLIASIQASAEIGRRDGYELLGVRSLLTPRIETVRGLIELCLPKRLDSRRRRPPAFGFISIYDQRYHDILYVHN
jgi:hypothetical protein